MEIYKKIILNENEKKVMNRHKRWEIFWVIALVLAAIFWAVLWMGSNGNVILIILGVIPIFFCYANMDAHLTEARRIQSGYYKKDFAYKCKVCENKIIIPFHELEVYKDLPRNEANIPVIECSVCQNQVQLFGYDRELKAYKKYLDQCCL